MSDVESEGHKHVHDRNEMTHWAPFVPRLSAEQGPTGARTINLNHRRVVSPLQGFGPLWQKTLRVRLEGVSATPEEIIALWKMKFPELQPQDSHFYPSIAGVLPGELMWIEATVPPAPGLPSILPVATGVLILYADETSFTVVTPEGHPVAGLNTFSAYTDDDGTLVAQIDIQVRTSDPLYELFYHVLGTAGDQDRIWMHVLEQLAGLYGVHAPIEVTKTLLDPRIQWRNARNIQYNAGIRTVFHIAAAPFRWIVRRRGRRRPGTAR
jgi:hypothetical protein